MALRNILTNGDETLNKQCRPVTEFNTRLHMLLDVLRQAVIVMETNVPEGEEEKLIELINPEIIAQDGEQTGAEGCLSVPGEYGIVTRPMNVTVRAQNRFGQTFEVSGTGLTARCFCHEIDHLSGHLFLEKCERMLTDEELVKNEVDE